MPEQNKPFVITDRRKFTQDGTPRPDADPSPERERAHVETTTTPDPEAGQTTQEPQSSASVLTFGSQSESPESQESSSANDATEEPVQMDQGEPAMPPPPTPEQLEQSRIAYQATADRIDVAIRSANPGMDHPPAMSFDQIVQSVYMQAIMQLGGGTQEGQQPQVDLLGARQSIDMLTIIGEKSSGNLSSDEHRLIDSAIFELRLAFLEITQALARSAAARAGSAPGSPSGPGGPGGPGPMRPSIVR